MSTFFTIKNGDIVNKSSIKRAFDLPDGSYELEICRRNKRSLPQNNFYFGVCVKMIKDELHRRGHDEFSAQDVHDWLKAMFNYKEIINEETGEFDRIPRSTATLNKDEFNTYIERVQRYAAEKFSLVIPDPGEQMMITYE
jgi:hypothetical protein